MVEGAEVTEDGGRVRTRRGGSSGGAKGSPWLLYVFRVVNADNESRDGKDRWRAARLCSASRSNWALTSAKKATLSSASSVRNSKMVDRGEFGGGTGRRGDEGRDGDFSLLDDSLVEKADLKPSRWAPK